MTSSSRIEPCALPEPVASIRFADGRYEARFAATGEELDAVLRLRFHVFNLELDEGLQSSWETGRDEDKYDPFCHHLMVVERASDAVIGTYRMQTVEMAAAGCGLYTDGEFHLDQLPAAIYRRSLEVGRACIEREHRNRRVLFMLWRGLARYVVATDSRYLFGCCSLTSQDPREGKAVLEYLRLEGHLHPDFSIDPRPGYECPCEDEVAPATRREIPDLFRAYLRFGSWICGPPAIDREFKTIDFLALFDVEAMDPLSRKLFFTE